MKSSTRVQKAFLFIVILFYTFNWGKVKGTNRSHEITAKSMVHSVLKIGSVSHKTGFEANRSPCSDKSIFKFRFGSFPDMSRIQMQNEVWRLTRLRSKGDRKARPLSIRRRIHGCNNLSTCSSCSISWMLSLGLRLFSCRRLDLYWVLSSKGFWSLLQQKIKLCMKCLWRGESLFTWGSWPFDATIRLGVHSLQVLA